MKIYYFNDTERKQLVYVNTLSSEPETLASADGSIFDVKVRDNAIPFIKVWEDGVVLLSDTDLPKE